MTTRQDIVNEALKFNGVGNGEGYPGASNPFSKDLGRPNEFWCGDFVTDIYKRAGLVLPSMQTGLATGFDNCVDVYNFASSHGATISSLKALPGDLILINNHGSGPQPGHVELVTSRDGGYLYSIGGDSAPSNVDGFTGQGGVHRHKWLESPTGNADIISAVDMGKVVTFSAPKHKAKPLTLISRHLAKRLTKRLNNRPPKDEVNDAGKAILKTLIAAAQRVLDVK